MSKESDRYQNTLKRLQEQLELRLPADQARKIGTFAALLYRSVSAREIEGVPLDDLYGSILEGWYFLQQRDPVRPKIRVFNPSNEANGWASPHTIILLVTDDQPFQIDSIRMEVNRRGLTLHSIQNVIVDVQRHGTELISLKHYEHGSAASCESFIYMEIDRSARPSEQRGLKQALIDVLQEVATVTDDYKPMLECAGQLLLSVGESHYPDEAGSELVTFISWMIDNHFTFLGYERYRVVQHSSGLIFRADPASRLGLCRMEWGQQESRLQSVLPQQPRSTLVLDDLIGFAKSSNPVRVHRAVYGDYILIREFDDLGRVRCEHRFLGLYTSPVYFQSPDSIPVVRTKVDAVLASAALHPGSHDWKELCQILATYPRDDLFQIDSDELFESVLGVLHIHERRQVRLFVRRAKYSRYYSCLVYVPKDRYTTSFRQRVQDILCQAFDCDQVEFNTHLSESLLARTQFVLHLDTGRKMAEVNLQQLEQQVISAARSWQDDLLQVLIDHFGEAEGGALFGRFGEAFPAAYRDDFSPRAAVSDIERILPLTPQQPLGMSFYRPLEGTVEQLNFKLYHVGGPIPLSEVIPVMEHLGLTVRDEHPYAIKLASQSVWLHDFGLLHSAGGQIELTQVREIFQQAFAHTWCGDTLSDGFNRLVLSAGLSWRQVTVFRAYAAYMKQIGFSLSQEAIANSLLTHVDMTRLLMQIFNQRFDPDLQSISEFDNGKAARGTTQDAAAQSLQQRFVEALDKVPGLIEDRVLRRFNELINATVRCNYFQQHDDQAALVLKLMPQSLGDMPQPCPRYELFVHSARFEAVHLRTGKIARGGIRWSDQLEDYRTEVLGLLLSQQAKNTLIVPVVARGGFACRRLNDRMTVAQRRDEVSQCYRSFISAMLDVTDNKLDGQVKSPERVVCYDDDDPYLVVAADKGTVSFSDSANEIASRYRFWLGDGFASGGSQGYDHRAMAITARCAWVSVERHLRELGYAGDKPFSVIGIGSMAGDVFGNGMLLSDRTRLVAAFDQRHIFIDPNPDSAAALAERQRLFERVGDGQAGWEAYDPQLISEGGGVFSRSAKVINISVPMQRCFAIEAGRMSANGLIQALLKAPVTLLWNGGAGTYIKDQCETHADTGDKANDSVRINAEQLRCKVVVEGSHRLMTQPARVAFAKAGGACNGDFVDGGGGVNCSDHEVNIKILLDAQQRAGELTVKQRNQLLASMSDEVADRVLADSFQQFEAISMAQAQAYERIGEYRRYIQELEQSGQLDRRQVSLPDDDELDRRHQLGQGLTRPELAVLMALTKAQLKQQLLGSTLPDEPYLQHLIADAFPPALVDRFADQLSQHPLRRELISTRVANSLVNQMGASFIHRMQSTALAETSDIVRAYILARDIYDLPGLWRQIEALEQQDVRRDVQMRMLLELQRLIRRAARWLLRNRQPLVLSSGELERVQPVLATLISHMGNWLEGTPSQAWKDRLYFYSQAGVPEALSKTMAGTTVLYAALGMTEIIEQRADIPEQTILMGSAQISDARVCDIQAGDIQADKAQADLDARIKSITVIYCLLGEHLELFWFSRTIDALAVANHWQASARETLRDVMEQQIRRLVVAVLQQSVDVEAGVSVADPKRFFGHWMKQHELMITRWLSMLAELKNSDRQDYAMYTVATQRLAEIAIVL